MKNQRGAAMVEFAIIALLFFVLLLGIIEFARALFTWNTMVEATRRGARVAAVCPISTNGINSVKRATILDNIPGDTTNSSMMGLAVNNIIVTYLDDTMTALTPPADNLVADPVYDNIAFVQVEIAQDNANRILHSLIIPGFNNLLTIPPIKTTLPSESLGRLGPDNPVTQRRCYDVCEGTGC